jgi:dihydrofolate reductase
MSKVIFDMSMSLDGFVTASKRRPDEPLGEGGERLHDWASASDDDRDRAVLTGGLEGTGAMIAGRRTYDDSVPWR